mmetsp:Transcript_7694/g.23492  ORF Transcript_7694/g.23492 Transcript_7694/m.23492 type:complete len:241 (+) Transcript_7694:630-1352(+)
MRDQGQFSLMKQKTPSPTFEKPAVMLFKAIFCPSGARLILACGGLLDARREHGDGGGDGEPPSQRMHPAASPIEASSARRVAQRAMVARSASARRRLARQTDACRRATAMPRATAATRSDASRRSAPSSATTGAERSASSRSAALLAASLRAHAAADAAQRATTARRKCARELRASASASCRARTDLATPSASAPRTRAVVCAVGAPATLSMSSVLRTAPALPPRATYCVQLRVVAPTMR